MDIFQGESFYPYILDHKPGFFLNWFLYKLFKRVGLDENMKEDLKQMHREGTVVYAIKYKGHLDYLSNQVQSSTGTIVSCPFTERPYPCPTSESLGTGFGPWPSAAWISFAPQSACFLRLLPGYWSH